jgi:hypothetical protein
LDDGVLVYAVAALRTLWTWPLLLLLARSFFPGESDLLSPFIVFGLLAGGALTVQLSARYISSKRAPVIAAVIGLAAIGLALYLSVRNEIGAQWEWRWLESAPEHSGRVIMTVAPAVWLWWWGMTLGRNRDFYDGLAREFAIGLAGMLLVVVLGVTSQMLTTTLTLTLLLAYLALGLFILALATIQDARRYEGARAGHDLPLARHWWGTVGAIVATLLVVALLLSQLFMPETLGLLGRGATFLLSLVGQIFIWIIIIISYPILMALDWLIRNMPAGEREGPPPEIMVPDFLAQLREITGQEATVSAPVSQTPYWIVGGVLAAAVILLIFILAFRRFRAPSDEDVAESHESILTLDLLKAQLAQLFRRKRAGDDNQTAPFVALAGDEPHVRIRRVYQTLLVWAAARGVARSPGMTPQQYRTVLGNVYPGHDAQFAVITAAYDLARYGAASVTEERARAVDAAWQEVVEKE